MMSFVGGHGTASDEVMKNTLANLVSSTTRSSARTALNTSLREEGEVAEWIASHLDGTVSRFVDRSAAGQTASLVVKVATVS
jgi:hypothetical protein